MARMDEVLGRAAFTVDGRCFRWADVIIAARAWSRWSEIESRAAQMIAGRGRNPIVPDEAVEAEQVDFRYARNLLAADDLEEWLHSWGVSVEHWLEHIRSSAERRHGSTEDDLPQPPAAELATAAWVEAVCSGELERLARELAERVAVYEPEPRETAAALGAAELARMDEAFRRFKESAVSPEALTRQMHGEQLEWTRIDGRLLVHPDEQVVREAALCAQEGDDLGELAARAGARFDAGARFYVADSENPLRARLLAANAGELCGPLAMEGEHWLLEVVARVPPSLDDPELVGRAEEQVLRSAIERASLKRVRWHEGIAAAG